MVKTISVTCIIATAITMSTGHVGDYVLVSDSDGYLHVIENGEVVKSITINSVVTSVCRFAVFFSDPEKPKFFTR